MKTQPSKWEKLFLNDVTDDGLTFNILKQLIKFNIKEIKNEKN